MTRFFLVIMIDSEKSHPLKQEISPVGRNDTAYMRSFCKRLSLTCKSEYSLRKKSNQSGAVYVHFVADEISSHPPLFFLSSMSYNNIKGV